MTTRHLAPTIPLLLALAAGCDRTPPPTVAAAPIAPVAVKSATELKFPDVKFVEITRDAGITFVHQNGATGEKLLPETMGSGVAFLDYDSDGDQDLLFVNSNTWPGTKSAANPTQALYRNDGKGKFTDVTAETGLALSFFGQGVAVGDFDNDGDPDLYITALGGGFLYRNDKGKFVDVTTARNAGAGEGWPTSAAFFDMDNDGDLDLFICRYVAWSAEFDRAQNFQLAGTGQGRAYGPPNAFKGSFCTLLRNDDGRFVDISESSGIQVRSPGLKDPVAKSLGVAPYDIDGDGKVDLAVANDTVPNFLFHNLGGGKFEEIGLTSGVAFDQSGAARGAMGIDWADFKNDGSLGLAIGNFANEMTALYVTEDPQTLLFTDLASSHGLGAPTQPPLKFGLFFFDYDLDGRQDLLSANGHLENDIAKVQQSQSYKQAAQLFWNTGQPGRDLFALVGDKVIGPDLLTPIVGRGSAFADIDGDGDLDVVLTANGGPARLFRNDGGSKSNWIRVKLVGHASNRDGIGARLTLKSGETEQRRQVFPARGYLSSSEIPVTFGLGSGKNPSSLTVTWPSGKTTELKDLQPNQTITVDEDRGVVKP